ncbi:tigger transposable element-derived protein [Elysia marginata]|uniref:Tigger transposable element-derived protein n=1 Tax=Elysia marginata TaxID=1093978 RepID=A0AAV4F3E6_9GAST|nr:tigger transposable element-derived protein [Elysia marginata]
MMRHELGLSDRDDDVSESGSVHSKRPGFNSRHCREQRRKENLHRGDKKRSSRSCAVTRPYKQEAISDLARAMGCTSKSKGSTPSSASVGYRRYYTDEDLRRALQAVKAGKAISTAARENNIPRITLHDYVHGKSSVGKRAGRAPGIPADIEDQIVQKVVFAAEAGFPITKMQLLSKVGCLVKRLNIQTQFKDDVPSNEYWRSLKKRYP